MTVVWISCQRSVFCFSVGKIANYFSPTFKYGVPCVKKKKYV